MNKKINIMDVGIDRYTAKEVLEIAVNSMESFPVTVFQIVTSDSLLRLATVPGLTKEMSELDVVLAGETTLLQAAGVEDRKYLQDTENRRALKLAMHYMHKRHKRVYFLAEKQEEIIAFSQYIQKFYHGICIADAMCVTKENRNDEMIVNAINGEDVDCVLSVLSSPLQEELIIKNKALLNVNIWVNLGKEIIPVCRNRVKQKWITQLLTKRILQKEMKKCRKNGGN